MDELNIILIDTQLDILILTETWLYTNEAPAIQFKNYQPFHLSGWCKRSIFVKSTFNADVVTSISNLNTNAMIGKIKNLKLKIGVVYIKPSSSVMTFCSLNSELLQNKNLLLIGDMNINFLKK